ncbi:DUF6941 family protein [Planococcus citreus]|uniref:Uncharacterized protein n=1 Tax=Planococcus citreus TaxID=1373 RepID=A0A497YGN5_9BACL|nr:hypothetical protein [Planococcus citreus]RLJ90107.1 hypothetical protein DFR62_0249 [Planococcus citreus]
MTNKIGHIIACAEAFNTPNGEMVLKQPLNTINLLSLPSYYTFVVAVGMIHLTPQKYNSIVKLTSPSGKELAVNNMEFEVEALLEGGPPGGDGGFNVNFRNLVFEEEGDHVISVELNEDRKTLILPVFKKNL